MYHIGIIGSKNFLQERVVLNTIDELKSRFGLTPVILSGGNKDGAEKYVKKYVLEIGMIYKEYNPSYTGHGLYSAMPEKYYGKGFHVSQLYDRYRLLIINSDYLIFFQPPNDDDKFVDYAIKQAEKMKKKYLVIK